MAATNLDIITSSYRILTVIDEITPPSAEQAQTALTVLNDMLADYDIVGLRLGWYPQTNLVDQAPLDPFNVRAVKYLLARDLALHFGIPLTPDMKAVMDEVYDALSKRCLEYFESDLTGLPFAQGGFWGAGRV